MEKHLEQVKSLASITVKLYHMKKAGGGYFRSVVEFTRNPTKFPRKPSKARLWDSQQGTWLSERMTKYSIYVRLPADSNTESNQLQQHNQGEFFWGEWRSG